MKNNTKKGGLGELLRKAAETISVDLFGIEKTVNRSIINFFDKSARDLSVLPKDLSARITRIDGVLQLCLYHFDRPVRCFSVDEMVRFFACGWKTNAFDLKARIVKGLNCYLDELSVSHSVPGSPALHLRIRRQKTGLEIGVYRNNLLVLEVTVKNLIKHFTR